MMGYAAAQEQAPPLRFGAIPLIVPHAADASATCHQKDTTFYTSEFCSASNLASYDRCEPNNKACTQAFKDDGAGNGQVALGYARGAPQTLCDTPACGPEERLKTGPIQRGQVYFKNVGQISALKLEEDRNTDMTSCERAKAAASGACVSCCSSPWYPAFVKVSTNNPQTGIGNGIFYIKPRADLVVGTVQQTTATGTVDKTTILDARPAAPTDSGLPEDESFNAVLSKCIAQTCEEEMDTALGMTQMKTDFGEAYATDAEF